MLHCLASLILLASLTQCGLLGITKEDRCVDKVPDDVVAQNASYAIAANAARLAAVEAERKRVGAVAVVLHTSYSGGLYKSQSPFPSAVPIYLDSQSIQNEIPDRFAEFHGFEGFRTVYETEPGSHQYFIIDQVLGDGQGSIYLSQGIPGSWMSASGSMHSWHVTPDNRLVRAKFNPTKTNPREINYCGCGHSQSHFKNIPNLGMVAQPPQGIFMLPGNAVPQLHPDEMNVQYLDESIKINSVNQETGALCPVPVC